MLQISYFKQKALVKFFEETRFFCSSGKSPLSPRRNFATKQIAPPDALLRNLLKLFYIGNFWSGKPLFLVRVNGESMWPALRPGCFYLASGWLRIKVGDFLVFKNPANHNQILIKQVEKIRSEGCEVDGTVSWSQSSQDFGLITKNLILGRIL